ncbi:MAG: efflux RND transporter periplasmic adaptor subunit [Anaerolineales bacterium]|nr:efflux RND transporter periplasmic adaptor subunit [Anaerolineales bacterium]
MKKNLWMIAAALGLILASCGSPPPIAATLPPAESVATQSSFVPLDVIVASAKAQPAHETQMSFPISAPVKEMFVKEGDTVKAGQLLMTLYAPDLEGQVKAAELAAQAGELEYQYWLPHRYDRPPERQWQAKAEWDQRVMALEVAKTSFAQTSIYAPFDATVITVNVQTGELAQTGKIVITLADLAHMQIVTTDLSERDAPRAQVGQSAKIYIEALNANVTGKVIRIAPKSETVGGDVVYPVVIELDEQVNGLLWGMSAEVEINK